MLDLLPVGMVAALMLLLFIGYPVAFVLIGVTFAFALCAMLTDQMAPSTFALFGLRLYGTLADSLIFPAVPPLIFMGVALARSGLARDLFDVISHLLHRVPGGLLIAVLVLGILLAPSAGLLGAAVSVLALVALPTLMAERHDPALAAGAIAGAGTLGVILPPAIMLFFLADLVGTPIAAAFTGVLLPAALLVVLYVIYFVVATKAHRKAAAAEAIKAGPRSLPAGFLVKLLLPASLVGGVLAAIVFGWATPSQSGALGAAGAFLLALPSRSLTARVVREMLVETGHVTAMVFLIIIAASAFSFVFRVLGGDEAVASFLAALGLGDWGKLMFILSVIFVLGFFIDWLEIVLITLPIFAPVIAALDFTSHVGEPALVRSWLATAIAIVLQTSFLTPPFGFALFFLRGAAPPEMHMEDIYRGVAPIVAIQLVVLASILAVPWLATQLPQLVIR
jgi:tripartite ATP-independent transporter DctM subunit